MVDHLELHEKTVHVPGDQHRLDCRRALSTIKLVGGLAIVLGVLPLINFVMVIQYFISVGQLAFLKMPRLMIAIGLSLSLPVAKIVSGIGLMRVKAWARKLAILVFTVDYLMVLVGAGIFCLQVYRFRNAPSALYDDVVAGRVVAMLPTYILALVSMLFVAVLTRAHVRDAFLEKE